LSAYATKKYRSFVEAGEERGGAANDRDADDHAHDRQQNAIERAREYVGGDTGDDGDHADDASDFAGDRGAECGQKGAVWHRAANSGAGQSEVRQCDDRQDGKRGNGCYASQHFIHVSDWS
jgi:hypothetical protein